MRRAGLVAAAALVLLATACAHRGPVPPAGAPSPGSRERGLASWYGHPYHGRRTACGEVYDMYAMTAAHRTLPFGTRVRVTRRDDGRHVDVRINDRGPFVRHRIIDLSYAAACRIGLDRDGVAPVEVEVLPAGSPSKPEAAPVPVPAPDTAPAADAVPAPAPAADAVPDTDAAPAPDTTPAPASGCWWVQVGAFGDVDNARRARARLAAAGETVVVLEGPHGLARVRLGPFESEREATAARRRVLAEWPAATLVECG